LLYGIRLFRLEGEPVLQGLNQTIAYFDKLLTAASGRLRVVTTNP